MGHITSTACPCGYANENIVIGGGRMDFMTNFSYPAVCQEGRHMVNVNLKVDDLTCPEGHGGEVIPYTDPRLIGVVGDDKVSDWQGKTLTNGTYLCPSCGELNMHFNRPHILFD